MIVHLCGPSGAGKTTIATEISKRIRCSLFDGDSFRAQTGNKDFSTAGREQNMLDLAAAYRHAIGSPEPALGAFITPLASMRRLLRENVPGRLYFVWLDVPIAVCSKRDPKGLYAAETPNLPGVSFPLQPPLNEPGCITIHFPYDLEFVVSRLVKILDPNDDFAI